MSRDRPLYSKASEIILYRPLQKFFLQKIIENFNEDHTGKEQVPASFAELKTEHFYQIKKDSPRDRKLTLGYYFNETARRNSPHSFGNLDYRKLYLKLWKPFKNGEPTRFEVRDKYLELLLAFFHIPFEYSAIEEFLRQHQPYLKDDSNQDTRDEELEDQIGEFRKIEFFKKQEFFYRCYISDFEGLTKGALRIGRDHQKDSFIASLSIQRVTGERPLHNNQIQYTGILEESGGFTYLYLQTGEENSSRAFWALHTPNNTFAAFDYLTGTFNAVDKTGRGPVCGQLLLEKVDTEEGFSEKNFFEKEAPFEIHSRFAGKKFMPPVEEVNGMKSLSSLVSRETKAFAGLYKCYFLNMRGDLLRECIYHIADSSEVRGKVSASRAANAEPYLYRGKAYEKNSYIHLKIRGAGGDSYTVILNNYNKAHPDVFYGIYYGWDEVGRLRAGREVFIPHPAKDEFDNLPPRNHPKDSDTYKKLCREYQIDDFFENFEYSSFPKIINWVSRGEDGPGSKEPVPEWLEGTYVSLRLNPKGNEDAPYFKAVSQDILAIDAGGETVVASRGQQTLRGRVFKADSFLYLSVKAENRHRFAIYSVDTLNQYNEAIFGICLEVNDQVRTVVSNREILIRKATTDETPPGLQPITPEWINWIEEKQKGASRFLIGPTDNYLRLPRTPISRETVLKKNHDYGMAYFYTACFSALSGEGDSKVNAYLNEAFRHGFNDWARLARELNQGALRTFHSMSGLGEFTQNRLKEVKGRNGDGSYTLSPTAKAWQVPFRGKYNPEFIHMVFELYKTAEHELHIIGEVAKNVTGQNAGLVEKLDATLRFVLDKNPNIRTYRYQTTTPVSDFWLEKLIALKRDYGKRFKLYASREDSDLSNLNIILIDPYHEKNTNILIFTRDNDQVGDIPVPVFALVEKDYKHLSDGLLLKVGKITESFQALKDEGMIREFLGRKGG